MSKRKNPSQKIIFLTYLSKCNSPRGARCNLQSLKLKYIASFLSCTSGNSTGGKFADGKNSYCHLSFAQDRFGKVHLLEDGARKFMHSCSMADTTARLPGQNP